MKPKKQKEKTFEEEMAKLLKELDKYDPGSKEYGDILGKLEKIVTLRKQVKPFKDLDIASLVSSGVSLASILAILNYEKMGIITTKAFGIFMKGVK